MNIKEKVVVITGGSQGFGKALAKSFSEAGSRVIIASNNLDALEASATTFNVARRLTDVTSIEEMKALATYAIDLYGRIDVWINNAGIQIAPSNVEDVENEKLQSLFAVNFFGYFYGCQAVLPIMKRQGSGVIININSTVGLEDKRGISAYVASKFAIKGLALSIREEIKGTNIQVLGVYPGGMQTEIYKDKYPADFNDYMSVEYATQKVMDNIKATRPELDLVIRRPNT